MIKNLGRYAHPPKGGRNPLAGRHAAGSPLGSPTTPPNKASQPEPASNKTKGATKGFGTPRPPMTNPTNQAVQAQSQISAQPAPFKIPMGLGNQSMAINGPTQKPTAGLVGSKAPAHPPKQYQIKTKSHMVGVPNNPPRKVGKMTASATKGGHSLLYGD